MNVEQVKEFWQDRAETVAVDDAVTHRDVWQRWLEIEHIKKYVSAGDRVIDIGCGNGYTSMQIAPLVKEIVGIDYSDAMIRRAEECQCRSGSAAANARFVQADVLDLLPDQLGEFDLAISERCLINLAGWPEQQQAISNIAGVIRPGGRLIFIEGSCEGREWLNGLRSKMGLERMSPVWHNIDFDDAQVITHLERYFEIERRLQLGLYDLISRIVHPLLCAPAQPEYRARINEIAAKMSATDTTCDINGRVLALVLRRHG